MLHKRTHDDVPWIGEAFASMAASRYCSAPLFDDLHDVFDVTHVLPLWHRQIRADQTTTGRTVTRLAIRLEDRLAIRKPIVVFHESHERGAILCQLTQRAVLLLCQRSFISRQEVEHRATAGTKVKEHPVENAEHDGDHKEPLPPARYGLSYS